jgi:7-cyano-7-deazaguanine tRNA-ribosyltransferase
VYGGVKVNPDEIVRFQEQIDTDIATILDVPTGWKVSKDYAKYTVNETLHRASELSTIKTRDDIAWVGPIQGGTYLDLVTQSATEMGKLSFPIHALGSPTPVMERYQFDVLVDMILTTKMNLPENRPLHLFGAGHPFMFALAVALGCDIFDSAAYAIYARDDRYMTESGTNKLGDLKYFKCSCPVCIKTTPETLLGTPKVARQVMLAEHNLYVSFTELRRIKQAIIEGRLWEHLELRMHGHPSLLQALKRVGKYKKYLEKHSPITKRSGFFFFSSVGLSRPEVVRHRIRILERASSEANTLILFPQSETKPFHMSIEHRTILEKIQHRLVKDADTVQRCTYAAPFGVIPTELDEVYPLSQYEIVTPFEAETIHYVAKQVADYLERNSFERVILVHDAEKWKGTVVAACRRVCKKNNISLEVLHLQEIEKRGGKS